MESSAAIEDIGSAAHPRDRWFGHANDFCQRIVLDGQPIGGAKGCFSNQRRFFRDGGGLRSGWHVEFSFYFL
jgi:hypothetical protein